MKNKKKGEYKRVEKEEKKRMKRIGECRREDRARGGRKMG